MPETSERDSDGNADELAAKIARAELRARYYEAQIRVLEARRKLTALRQSIKDSG
jgi:outer membrane PBP1 activator LpoA protein